MSENALNSINMLYLYFKRTAFGSALYYDQSIYYFASSIHRIDLDEKESLKKVEIIGNHEFEYPALLQTRNDYCVERSKPLFYFG